MEEMRNTCKMFVGKSEGKRPVNSPRHRWESDIKEIECEGMFWIELAQDSVQ
jgi:hypothetical protein